MRIVNMIFSVIIGLGGCGYIIAGFHDKDMASVAVGWVMITYARQELVRDDIHELKDEIKDLKEKLKK